jgi:MFS family permease
MIGVLDTAFSTFFLLYMEKVLSADSLSKGIVAGGYFYGLLLSPFAVQICLNRNIRPANFSAFLFLLSALVLPISFLLTNTRSIAILFASCLMFSAASTPLITEIYASNYKPSQRGILFSISNMLKILGSMAAGYLIGNYLELGLDRFSHVFIFYTVLLFLNSGILYSYPKTPLSKARANSIWNGVSALKHDSLFRITLISWMIMGFGNLMLIPLRVEFLANPKFGVSLSSSDIALYVVVIPSIARLIFSSIWGVLFDKMNFFLMRILVNSGFIIGMLAFFMTGSSVALSIGSILIGLSNAGGDVAWNLWVTKFAPPGQTSSYMAIHTFFTGLRGAIAPLLGFYISANFGFYPILIVSIIMIILASSILFNRRERSPKGMTKN